MEEKYIIFHVEGGMGKSVISTAVIRAIKKQYPDRKIVVSTSWDGPFFYNPNIYRFYTIGKTEYFYDDYINNKDVKIFRQEVYHTEDHILQKKHLSEIWCEMNNIKYDGYKPEIYLNPRELEIAKDKIKPDGKPIMLLQSHGGSPSTQYSKKSWFRDLPVETAQHIVDYFKKDYRILHVKLPEQPTLKDVEPVNLPHRELYAVFPLSEKRVFIDSSSQHIAAALGLQSTVCWIGNKPEVFGYPEHINIIPKANYVRELNKYSYLEKFSIDGFVQAFPYDTVNVFDVDEIIEGIKKQK